MSLSCSRPDLGSVLPSLTSSSRTRSHKVAEWVEPIVKDQGLALKLARFLDKPPGHGSGLLGHAKPNTKVSGVRFGHPRMSLSLYL